MDKVTIRWTQIGYESFEEVVQYIVKDSPYYGSNFASKILNLVEQLSLFPRMGREVPEYQNPTIRELIYQNYRIVYEVQDTAVWILLIIHGSRWLPETART